MLPIARQIVVALAAVFVSIGASGCGATCDTSDQIPERYEGGTVVNGFYSSSTAHGDLLSFPGGKRYDIVHHLGFEPILVQLYWSFSESGIGYDEQTPDKSSLTLATGNSALIQLKNAEFIRVKNDSCAEFSLLVVASGDPRAMDAAPPDLGDASAE